DATLALRDLSLALPVLEGSDRRAAKALLARPAATQQTCTAALCVHYDPAAVAPGYPDLVLGTMQDVHDDYLAAGYRAPKSDGTAGGDGRLDLYLEDTGADRVYGYCVPTGAEPTDGWDMAAYCVLDDDFSTEQFSDNTPLENLQVTAAHEYFHAVQFGYDVGEDQWLLEATATWAEDELYPDVDDNTQYLDRGPLRRPSLSLDTFEDNDAYQYGAWIFFRYLSEKVATAAQGSLPTIVREIWERADGRAGAPDDHSMLAVSNVLATHGTSLRATYSRFADANRRPGTTYAEGTAQGYPVANPARTIALRTTKRSSGTITRTVDHLASSTVRFTPASNMTSSRWRLKIKVDLDSRSRAAALVSVTARSGRVTTTSVTLDAKAQGAVSVPFEVDKVSRVELTTTNASSRYTCGSGTTFACQGTPKDDNKAYVMSGVAYKR
ncbi:MAG: MXAN_6640 family putative metalloprotease, partial [Aeromicrobium sp.]